MTTPLLAENVRGRGRHYRHPNTGDLVPSITNIIGALSKGDALTRWSAKMVAETAYSMRHSLANMEEADAVDMLKQSPWRTSTRAADRGTTIHAYLEARMLGLKPDIIDGEALRYRDAAEAWLDDWKPEVIATERTVFGPDYAGTGDLWCRRDGKVVIVDFKTSKAIYKEAALQIAALWAAPVQADGSVDPAPDDAEGWVVRIGEDGYEARQVLDLPANYEVFRSLIDAWHWSKSDPYKER
jgi:hypothetical protein